jgi:hypothetical protein
MTEPSTSANEDASAEFWAELRRFDRAHPPPHEQVIQMLKQALARAERGEIASLAIIATDQAEAASVGYVEGDHLGGLNEGAVFVLHALTLAPSFELAGDSPSRRLAPIR